MERFLNVSHPVARFRCGGEVHVSSLVTSVLANLPILPLFIFVAEVCVVTLCTVRIIFIARGMKVPAAILGFFEVSIWLFAIGQVMQNLSDVGCYLGFAAGFALGNYLGVSIEQKLALGNLVVRIITNKDGRDLSHKLTEAGYGVTRVDGEGATGPVQVLLTLIPRKELKKVVAVLKAFDSKIFYAVDDVQTASRGIFPAGRTRGFGPVPLLLRLVDVPRRGRTLHSLDKTPEVLAERA
jgi:uncharacterized protein YebE (UPF0316 family)